MRFNFPLFKTPVLTGRYLARVLKSRWLTTGPMCQRLKEKTAEFLKTEPDRIVLASSATACFQAILDLLQPRGVWLQPDTWPGLHHVLKLSDAYIMEPANADLLVHTDIGGAVSAFEFVDAPPPTVPTLHDACHSWYRLPFSDYFLASFYPTKLVPGAEGGVIVAPSPVTAQCLERLLYCGLCPGSAAQGRFPASIGRKANMTDITAALNLEALELAPGYIEAIGEAHERMAIEANRIGIDFKPQVVRPYLFQARARPRDIPTFIERLRKRGIGAAWNFYPNDLLTLPCYPGLRRADARKILETAMEVAREIVA